LAHHTGHGARAHALSNELQIGCSERPPSSNERRPPRRGPGSVRSPAMVIDQRPRAAAAGRPPNSPKPGQRWSRLLTVFRGVSPAACDRPLNIRRRRPWPVSECTMCGAGTGRPSGTCCFPMWCSH
jgi:hypothetical protein